MLKRGIDLSRPLRCVRYGRMSGEQQNPRSPDQQFDEIDLKVERQRRPWTTVATYRDDALSGRLFHKRPGLQAMLRDIRTKRMKVDAILIDTWERIGRADELAALRTELWNKYGVVVLTANTDFMDPTTECSQIVGMFEQVRATAGNTVKAHEVFRGKRDLALRKRWPGGPPPFGKRLRKCIDSSSDRDDVYSVLEDDAGSLPIVLKLLKLARDKGWGSTRLTKTLNLDPEIPDKYKPFNASTSDYILDNPIYVGDLRWAANCQGISNDVRVIQKNPDDEVVWVKDFCAPVYPRADWDEIQRVRKERFARARAALQAAAEAKAAGAGVVGSDGVKQIVPLAAGMTLNYLLSGLVYCAECNSRMVATSSKGASRSGKKLSYYRCPLAIGGGCVHRRYLREDKLRTAVLGKLRAHLFPAPLGTEGVSPPWLAELMAEIDRELRGLTAQAIDPRPGLFQELHHIESQMAGWMQSLGKSELGGPLRHAIEAQYAQAAGQATGVRERLAALDGAVRTSEQVLDVSLALDRLQRLDEVLASGNLTAGNLELSLHIERIDAHADGRVLMRTSKLGIFEGAAALLSRGSSTDLPKETGTTANGNSGGYRVRSRRRAKLLLENPDQELMGTSDLVRTDEAAQFTGLPPQWFWNETLEITDESYWSADHACEVAVTWADKSKRWTKKSLAAHFGVSIPTINKALRLAAATETKSAPEIHGDIT